MRIKTIVIIVITILLTIALTQNTGDIYFKFLWATFLMSKLVVLLFIAIIAFVLGVLVGRPKRIRKLSGDVTGSDPSQNNTNTLSDEDKDYIS